MTDVKDRCEGSHGKKVEEVTDRRWRKSQKEGGGSERSDVQKGSQGTIWLKEENQRQKGRK